MNRIFIFISLMLIFSFLLFAQQEDSLINLLSLQEGALPVVSPENYPGWPAEALLDESPSSGYASNLGKILNNAFVFELLQSAEILRFEFDNASIDAEGADARDILVEISNESPQSGFEAVLKASLSSKKDGQAFRPDKKVKGRFVRLTILNNHGSEEYTELFSFRGYGIKPEILSPLDNISGTYDTDYSKFHVRQQGTSLTGCYEYSEGLLDGLIEGRLMKITWREGDAGGPAVMVFSPDGTKFNGFWWHQGNEGSDPDGKWDGIKISSEIGGCPHWSGSLGSQLKGQLESGGRARVYGILFDLNKAVIRDESRPVLEEMAVMLQHEPEWRLLIEGHTDSSGSSEFNRSLSLKRAEAVMNYLVKAGINKERLETKGLGSSMPVADNHTEAGRAQNRRVELVKQ